uniref:Uncharacterized protein n=1 Tax=Timema poppense TaxID=170557 RepID=A0A7R9DAA1_TIMPO|nr:unnamed protein product [Timema poppensis]
MGLRNEVPSNQAANNAEQKSQTYNGSGHTNTYFHTMTKISPSLKEPVCGWIDNVYGPNGAGIGVFAGLIRTGTTELAYVTYQALLYTCSSFELKAVADVQDNKNPTYVINTKKPFHQMFANDVIV